jgi:hypothetical protein
MPPSAAPTSTQCSPLDDVSDPAPPGRRRSQPRRPSPLQATLKQEWAERFAGGRVAAPPAWRTDERLARYRLAAEPLADLDAPDTPPERAEEVARALTEAAAAGDDVAARVMLQHLLPSLMPIAWGFGRGPKMGEEFDVLDTLVSTIWLSLADGVALAGPGPVRQRLLRDAEYRVIIRPRRRRTREFEAALRGAGLEGLPERLAAADRMGADQAVAAAGQARMESDMAGRAKDPGPTPGEELLEVVCEAVGLGLSLRDAQVLSDLGTASFARSGLWAAAEAARLDPAGVSSRCIRHRRAMALRRIRSVRAEAA